jgi:hypothetical protein
MNSVKRKTPVCWKRDLNNGVRDDTTDIQPRAVFLQSLRFSLIAHIPACESQTVQGLLCRPRVGITYRICDDRLPQFVW